VPTPPMGLYSTKHKKAEDVKAGATVVVPNDPVNLQRALWILRDLGWIEIKDNNPVDVTELDVVKNPKGIKIVPLENAQAPRALGDADLRTLLARIQQPVQQAVATMPSQADFIERYCKAPAEVWPRSLATA